MQDWLNKLEKKTRSFSLLEIIQHVWAHICEFNVYGYLKV